MVSGFSVSANDSPSTGQSRLHSTDSAGERIRLLRAEIAKHDELYFRKAAPAISDFAYDQLKRELKELEEMWPEALGNDVSSSNLGDDRVGGFPEFRHRVRMMSLNKSYTEKEMKEFDTRLRKLLGRDNLEYVVEPKFDGLAIAVTYENGQLTRAVTRGDGETGDDVTNNILTIAALPKKLAGSSFPAVIEVRGEVYLEFSEFVRLNQERENIGEVPYANPRNLAAGTLKLHDPAVVASRNLKIVFFGAGAWEPAASKPVSQWVLYQQLREWGLSTVQNPRLVYGSEAMWMAVQAVGRERRKYEFPTDGAVVKLNQVVDQERVGSTMSAPFWAMAYKFAAPQIETRLRAITWQVGRSGVLSPVAELEPVVLGGSKISRASLHNRDEITRRDIRIGDFVYVEKAGEIIPVIAGVNLARRSADVLPYGLPSICPSCQTALVLGPSTMSCPNVNCSAQVSRRIEHYASASSVAIKGLGPAMVEKLVAAGCVKTVADLYRLRREDLLSLAGVGEKTAVSLLAAIERSKHAELWRVINGLGIPAVGETGARALALRFGGLAELAQVNSAGSVAGLGQSAMESVRLFFNMPVNQMVVADLLRQGVGLK